MRSKRLLAGIGLLGILTTGIILSNQPAECAYCRPTMVPFGYEGTGQPCSNTCDSELWQNRRTGATSCVVYGPRF